MKLDEVLDRRCIDVDGSSATKDQLLHRIAELAVRHPALDACVAENVYRALRDRENAYSTGFGNGIAIPHCRLSGIAEFCVGLITIPRGIEFTAQDNRLVRLAVFIIAPANQNGLHVRLLSEVSQALRAPDAVDRIVNLTTPGAIADEFLSLAAGDVSAPQQARMLVRITVQDRRVFKAILKAIVSLVPGTATVSGARTADSFLSLPRFAFCKVITALIPRVLVNETIRRVEQATGRLDEREGVVLSVSEPAYAAGELTPSR